MNPTHEYVLKEALIGLMRGLANAFETLQASLVGPAGAHGRAEADMRAICELRRQASEYDLDPDAAELRFWAYIEAGLGAQSAFHAVRSKLVDS